MVAKPVSSSDKEGLSLNLAKIHMVAKLYVMNPFLLKRLNLAKIHMVAKPVNESKVACTGLNLAKIHMVAKQYHLLC